MGSGVSRNSRRKQNISVSVGEGGVALVEVAEESRTEVLAVLAAVVGVGWGGSTKHNSIKNTAG